MLISEDFNCKVCDFGRARRLGTDPGLYYRAGPDKPVLFPIRWSAPEAYNDRHCTEKSDVWSFGILCHEVFTSAVLPYAGMDNSTVEQRVQAGYRLPQPSECPEEVYRELMLACWNAAPEERPTFAQLKVATQAKLEALDRDSGRGGGLGDMISRLDRPSAAASPVASAQSQHPGMAGSTTGNAYVGVVGRSGSVIEATRVVDSAGIPMAMGPRHSSGAGVPHIDSGGGGGGGGNGGGGGGGGYLGVPCTMPSPDPTLAPEQCSWV